MIEKILQDRQKTHGDFSIQSNISQDFKDICHENNMHLTKSQKEAIDMIVHKIARILAGNSNEIDHWVDIAGYAMLVANQLKERE